MTTNMVQKRDARPIALNNRDEKILKTIYFYRYVTALDIAQLLFSPSSLTHVREILGRLSGNGDYKTGQFLYRFRLPSATPNSERVYTLGSRGRDYLANVHGLPVDWYFRPSKVKHMGYGQVVHNLTLTRFLVAAKLWCKKRPEFRLTEVRSSYELARVLVSVRIAASRNAVSIPVIPDAWLLFERVKDGEVARSFPILLEIDRGTAYQQKFKQHVASRVEYVASGTYQSLYGKKSVTIAYATTGATPEYRETRRKTMCAWTREELARLRMNDWAAIFRFHGLSLADIYSTRLFEEPVWYRPDAEAPVPLFMS